MTGFTEQRNEENPDAAAGSSNGAEEYNPLRLNNHTSDDEISPEGNGEEASGFQMRDDNTQTDGAESESSEGGSPNKYYFGEWSGAEYLYKLVTQGDESDDDFDWSESPPTPPPPPPPPEVSGINLELSNEQRVEDDNDVNNLAQSLDNISLAPPSQAASAPRDQTEDIIRYLQIDFQNYREAIAQSSEEIWDVD